MKLVSKVLLFCLIITLVALPVFAANENPEGQVTIVGSNMETLNPLLSESSYETTVLNGIFSRLVYIDEKGNYFADLAKEVPTVENGGVSEDGLIYTFHLREDARWHDGEPVTSEDVAFTWDRIMHDKVAVVSRDGFDEIERIETPDPYTVVMYKNKATADWLLNWAQTGGSIIPKHIWKDVPPVEFNKGHEYSRKPIGSGAFKFVEWVPGSYLIMEANKDYYGEGPYLGKVIYKEVESPINQLSMLQTGEADVALNIEGQQLDQVKNIDRLDVTLNPASVYVHMTYNLDNPIFQDKRTRQALSYAIPRELIVEKTLNGVGIPAATSTSPIHWAYNEEISPRPFDMDKARSLLSEVGWRDVDNDGILEKGEHKFEFTLYTNAGRQIRERIAQIAQQYWKQLGVKVNLEFQESTTLYGPTLEHRKFDMIMFGWITGASPDETTLYHSEQIPTPENQVGQNYAGYVNEDVDALLDAALLLNDNKDRKPLYHKIQQILFDELPMLCIYYYVNIDVAPKNLENFRPAPFTNGRTWNINQWRYAN